MTVPKQHRTPQTNRFCAVIVWFFLGMIPVVSLQAQFPNAQLPDPTTSESTVVLHRPCVLLKNDKVLFGDAHQLGEFILVRTGPDDELRLPRSEVACWAKSLTDLYQYRLDHRPTADLRQHLIDANWCLQYELLDLATKELNAAKAIASEHPEVQLLESQLQRRRQPTEPSIATIETTSFLQESLPEPESESNQIDPLILKNFSSHVQSTLINRCGRCHNQHSQRNWQLLVPSGGTRATARMTRENLTSTLRMVDPNDPQNSPLLIKATSPHGGTEAPLTVRNAKAVVALRQWLQQTTRMVAPAQSDHAASTTPKSQQTAYSEPESLESNSAVIPVSFESEIAATPTPSANSNAPARLPTVANPFDPSLFNRRFHRRDQ